MILSQNSWIQYLNIELTKYLIGPEIRWKSQFTCFIASTHTHFLLPCFVSVCSSDMTFSFQLTRVRGHFALHEPTTSRIQDQIQEEVNEVSTILLHKLSFFFRQLKDIFSGGSSSGDCGWGFSQNLWIFQWILQGRRVQFFS